MFKVIKVKKGFIGFKTNHNVKQKSFPNVLRHKTAQILNNICRKYLKTKEHIENNMKNEN